MKILKNAKKLAAGLALCLATLPLMAGSALAQDIDSDLFSGLKARLVGPAGMSGRIAAVDAVASDPNTIVVGASTGGLWISHNGGLNWEPVFDDKPVASIGAVAINQKNPDIIWVGTGEGNVRNSTSVGGGVYKSIDGGKSFSFIGLEKTERINRIALHPDNPDIAYVAALGELWGENAERGVYKTVDGGKSWNKVLYVDQKTGATDIRMVPGNPDKLFAGMWQFRRWPYFFKSGGAGSGIYVSHDGGATWEERTEEDGLPKGELGRSAFAISPSNPERIYALIEAEKSALARSDDGGRSWALVNQDNDINDRPFYYNDIAVDPLDENRVYRIGSRVKLSIDGGKTFDFIEAIDCCAAGNDVHIDTHAWWINPANPKHMIDGNDGGIAITHDKGETWRFVENLPLAQFYHIAVDNEVPYNIYGGLQDNGSWRGPSELWANGGIRNFHWIEVSFGDGFDTIPDPENANRGYSLSQGGTLYSWNLETSELRLLQPSAPDLDTQLRFNWNAGVAVDPFDSNVIYLGSQFVHKSTDKGLTWETISGDLTTNNEEFQTFTKSGGLTPDVTAAENYTSITMIVPSPIEKGTIWVGSDDGRVHVTRDGGETWRSVEGRSGAPRGAWVTMIEPSPHNAGEAFITIDDHRRGNKNPYVYRVSNYGQSWRSIVTSDISGYVLSVRQDPVDPDLLFLGTEFGLHVSLNGGRKWSKWTQGVPTVAVADLAIQARESDLVIGTHGRAAFVIDDYSALRNLSANDFSKRFALLSVNDGQQYSSQAAASSRFTGSGEFRGENEAYGAMITFMASGDDLVHPDKKKDRTRLISNRENEKETSSDSDDDEENTDKPKTDKKRVKIEVSDAQGNVIRKFTREVHQGINRVNWNLRRDGLKPLPPAKSPEDGTLPPGFEVMPGSYTVKVEFDGVSEAQEINVLADPRSEHSLADMRANQQTRLETMKLSERYNEALLKIIEARRDIKTVTTLIAAEKSAQNIDKDDEENPLNKLEKQAGELTKKLGEIESKFRVPENTKGIVYNADKISSLIGNAQFYIGSTYGAPSPTTQLAINNAQASLDAGVAALNEVLAGDLAGFREAVSTQGLTLMKQSTVK